MKDILVGTNGQMALYEGKLVLTLMGLMYDYDGNKTYDKIFITANQMIKDYTWAEAKGSIYLLKRILGSIDGDNGIGAIKTEDEFIEVCMSAGLNTYNTVLVVSDYAYEDYMKNGYTKFFEDIIVNPF